jgi:hypothetical protein
VSFVNTLRDGIDVAERTGLGIVADIGNFWMERDLRATLLDAAPHIALVQLTTSRSARCAAPMTRRRAAGCRSARVTCRWRGS